MPVPGCTVSMYRREGAALLATSSLGVVTVRLDHNREFLQAIRENMFSRSLIQERSEHGDNMLVSFRRVGDYPVYVASTMNLGELRGVWLRDLLMLTPVTLIPGAMTGASILLWALRSASSSATSDNSSQRQPERMPESQSIRS